MSEEDSSNTRTRPRRQPHSLRVRVVQSLEEVREEDWDGLDHGPSPFLRHGFLRALERSGSIGDGSGWYPFYIVAEVEEEEDAAARRAPCLVGAVAAFVKTHSYGEYIFDWSWAGACERAGISYYPKLVVAAPVTPATGHRILVAPGWDREAVGRALVDVVKQLAEDADCSSVHWLFTTAEEQALLTELGFAPRASYQFHWHNRDYVDFDDFLSRLTSRKRKQLRKERRRALAAVDGVDLVSARSLGDADLDAMDRFYRNTTCERGGSEYLRPGFFHHLAEAMPDAMLMARARKAGVTIGGALYLETDRGLYGRYWGSDEHVDLLHFEMAYYLGIERCIERGTPLFEAGAQGEHKLLRGFEPSPTYSSHWIRHPDLDRAVRQFLTDESRRVAQRIRGMAEYGPYKCDD